MSRDEDRDDRELRAAFSELRREEQEHSPPFTEVVRRGRARSLRSRSPQRFHLRWAAVGLVLAVLAAWLGLRTPGPKVPATQAPSLAEWRSPTDFLLETSGREILADPARLDRSLLDFSSTVASQERRSPS
jgi:hypothetical protein